MAEAHSLNCLMCGAPASSDATACEHCGARLATVACPSCFGMIFQGSRFCPLCGARADREAVESTSLPCPGCQTLLTKIKVGHAILCECEKCEGFWVDTFSFQTICTDREQQAAILGTAVILPPPEFSTKVRYVKCPECQDLMARVNFAGCSGVVIDVCRQHGSWFDAKELQRIVQFIRAGGMDLARQKQIEQLREERLRARANREPVNWEADNYNRTDAYGDAFDAIWEAGSVVFRMFND
jgi:Zn-finger nucleic acid-binding protein